MSCKHLTLVKTQGSKNTVVNIFESVLNTN